MLRRALLVLLFTLASSLLLGVGLVLYARFIEPYWVEEVTWELPCAEWKGRPVKLALLTDLHAKAGDGAYLDRIVERTLAAGPDAVLLLGDYINDPPFQDSMPVEELLRHLKPLTELPCFAVLGNHDHMYWLKELGQGFQQAGIPLMEGRCAALEAGGDTLYIGGVLCLCAYSSPGHVPTLPEDDPHAPLLILSHSPAGARYVKPGTSATLAGHTHGGQVCLPGGLPILRPDSRVRWEEMKGAYREQGRPVYVSRGLGTSELPIRLFCRPELTFVLLHGTS